MSFKTSNNRILVRDAANRITLDTDQPMPHILQTAAVSLSCGFPGDGGISHSHSHTPASYLFYYNKCQQEYVCGPEQVCGMDYSGQFPVYKCTTQTVCGFKQVCRDVQGWETETNCWVKALYAAREWSQVQNIVGIINGIDADFIQVSVEAARTVAGTDPWYGTLVFSLPAGRVLAQGSVVLESAFLTGGSSWLRRIMSIYVENGIVKVLFKHSNRYIEGGSVAYPGIEYSYSPFDAVPPGGRKMPKFHADAPTVSTPSSFSFNFYVTIGKFTK